MHKLLEHLKSVHYHNSNSHILRELGLCEWNKCGSGTVLTDEGVELLELLSSKYPLNDAVGE